MVGRYVRFAAASGDGPRVAELLLEAADSVRDAAGCRLYAINAEVEDPDVVWVTELWSDQAALDAAVAALGAPEARPRIREIGGLLAEPPSRIELAPLGGVGVD